MHKKLIGCGIAATLLSASIAQATMIDNFNVATEAIVTADNFLRGPNSAPTTIDGTNIVMDGASGWTRTITAELTGGVDTIETIVCATCRAGHVNAEIPATGIGEFIYTGGTAVDIVGNNLVFDYMLDLDGTVVDFIFSNGVTLSSGPLASRLALTSYSIAIGANNLSNITGLTVRVTGTEAADFTIDNIRTVPLPAPLLLMMSGLLGLAIQHKNKRNR